MGPINEQKSLFLSISSVLGHSFCPSVSQNPVQTRYHPLLYLEAAAFHGPRTWDGERGGFGALAESLVGRKYELVVDTSEPLPRSRLAHVRQIKG